MRIPKISTYLQNLRYDFHLNQNWRKVNITLFWVRTGLFLMLKLNNIKNRLNIKDDCFKAFKMNLNSAPKLFEDNESEMLITASISTLKRSSKECGRNDVFDLVQTSLDTDITHDVFDELLQNIVQINAIKLWTIGDREYLSLRRSNRCWHSKQQDEKWFKNFSITTWQI